MKQKVGILLRPALAVEAVLFWVNLDPSHLSGWNQLQYWYQSTWANSLFWSQKAL